VGLAVGLAVGPAVGHCAGFEMIAANGFPPYSMSNWVMLPHTAFRRLVIAPGLSYMTATSIPPSISRRRVSDLVTVIVVGCSLMESDPSLLWNSNSNNVVFPSSKVVSNGTSYRTMEGYCHAGVGKGVGEGVGLREVGLAVGALVGLAVGF